MPEEGESREWVAIILAIGLVGAFFVLTVAILWASITQDPSRLSENATQILSAVFGGIIGILGSYLGFRSVSSHRDKEEGRPNVAQDETSGDDG